MGWGGRGNGAAGFILWGEGRHDLGQPKPQDLASTAKWSTEVDSDGLINE